MNQTPSKVIYLVIIAIAILAFMGVTTLCLSLFLKTYADPAILTALISLTSGLTGSLVTLLSSTRTQTQPPGAETVMQMSSTTTTKPTQPEQTATEPQPVQVVNSPADPVPTTEAKP